MGKEAYTLAQACLRPHEPCYIDSAVGIEYAGVTASLSKLFYSKLFYQASPTIKQSDIAAPNAAPLAWQSPQGTKRGGMLRVGLLSSDYNVHPVPTLLRGVIQLLHQSPGIGKEPFT